MAEFRTCLRFYGCPCYLQEWRRSNKKLKRLHVHNIFSIITLLDNLLPWEPESWSDLAKKLKQSFLYPNGASDKIWLWSPHWLRRYSCLSVNTHTHTRARRLDGYTISSPCELSAQVSLNRPTKHHHSHKNYLVVKSFWSSAAARLRNQLSKMCESTYT